MWFFRIKKSTQRSLTRSLWPWTHPKGMYLSAVGNNRENLCQKHSGALFGFPGNTITHGAIAHADALMRYGSLTTKTSSASFVAQAHLATIRLSLVWMMLPCPNMSLVSIPIFLLYDNQHIGNSVGHFGHNCSKCSSDMKPLKNTRLQSSIHYVAHCKLEVTRWLQYQNLAQSLLRF